ncbi:MAG: hypothetical protein KI785_06695, partial [Devosiaceae bacterium]|nr:hypothetical protein [Devosiaceae bacterium MH13]
VQLLTAQLDSGDFAGAAVTLQRILLVNPTFDRARLVRVAVFLRLGDHAAARADLAFLAARPLNAEDRAEAARLQGLVRESAASPSVTGVIRTGVLYDSNPGLAPRSGNLTGTPFNFPAEDAVSAFGELEFVAEVPFAGASGHAFRVEGRAFGRLTDGDDGHSYGRLAAGPRFDLGFAWLDLMGLVGADLLGGDLYTYHGGARARLTVDVNDRVELGFRGDLTHENYDIDLFTPAGLTAGDADGTAYVLRPSVTVRLSDTWRVIAHAGARGKDAGSAWFSYSAYGGGLAFAYRNARGYSFRAGASLEAVEYDAADPRVGGAARDETRLNLDTSLAIPFAEIARAVGQGEGSAWARPWALEAFGRYTRNESNLAIYESDNWTVGLAVARRFSL